MNNFLDCSEYCANSNVRVVSNMLSKVFGLNVDSECNELREFDANILRSLQECIGVEYSNGKCRVLGESKTALTDSLTNSPLVTKSCVKVGYLYINVILYR